MNKDEMQSRIRQLEAEVNGLEQDLDTKEDRINYLRDELAACVTREDVIAEMSEQECIRCHKTSMGFSEQRYCTRDCREGWTQAPSFEQWYRTLPTV